MFKIKFVHCQKLLILPKKYMYSHEKIPLEGPLEARAARMDMKFRKQLAQIQNVQIQICTLSKNTNITQKIYMYSHETIPLKGPSEVRAARMDMKFRKQLAQIQYVQIQICTLSKTTNITQKIYMYLHETIPLKGTVGSTGGMDGYKI
jgi:hypothetical protein